MLGSLRSRVLSGMGLLLVLVLALAMLAVNTISALDKLVSGQLASMLEIAQVGAGLVSTSNSQIRAADQYLTHPSDSLRMAFLTHGDSAYSYQRRYQQLSSLGNNDRIVLNRIADVQARIEVAYGRAFALTDLGRPDEARAAAEQARAPATTLTEDVQRLSDSQSKSALRGQQELQRETQQRRTILWLLFSGALAFGLGTVVIVVRAIDLPLKKLVGAADRFGAGDLRPLDLGEMPTELGRLAHALDRMRTRLRGLVESVIGEARSISANASDFSAMSEELAATSGEISTAMVRVADSAERQASGMRAADVLLVSLRETAVGNTAAARRVVDVGDRIRRLAEYHRGDVSGAGQGAARRPRGGAYLDGAGADPRAHLARHLRLHRADQADLVADQPAGAERRDRGGAGGRAWTRLRRRRRGSAASRRLERAGGRGGGPHGHADPAADGGSGGHDGRRLGEGVGRGVGGRVPRPTRSRRSWRRWKGFARRPRTWRARRRRTRRPSPPWVSARRKPDRPPTRTPPPARK